MKRIAIVTSVLVVFGLAVPLTAQDKCTCDVMKKEGAGWCAQHKMGMCTGMEVKSEKAYKTLAGEPAPKACKCKECEAAVKADGWCATCKVGYAHGNMYHCKPAWEMGKGTKADPAAVKCEECKKLLAEHKDGYCAKCDGGLVGGYAFKSKAAFELAQKAHALMKEALALMAKCETCGLAMLTDGKCDHCKVEYKDGKKVGDKPAGHP